MIVAYLASLLFAGQIFAQPAVYHCQYETRTAATKQTVDTVVSDDGSYSYTVSRDVPLRWDIRSRQVIQWWGATNLSDNANAIMDQGFQDWEDETGINFEKLGISDNSVFPNQDGKTQMLVADPADLFGASGKTQRFGAPTTSETDIGYDPNIAGGSNNSFILSIVRHEIGHLLGLGHVDGQNSLMFATIQSGSTKGIDSGSKDGIAFLYGDKIDLDNLKRAYDESVVSGARDLPLPSRAYTIRSWTDDSGDLLIREGDTIYRSSDGGNEWTQISENDLPGLGVSPGNPDVSYYQKGFAIYKSEDGGLTETFLFEAPFFGTAHDILVLNDFLVWFGTEKGVYKTSDGGQSFLAKNGGLPEEFDARALVQHPTNPSTFYVGGTEGVYKTVNSAANWTPLPKGLGATDVKVIQVTNDGRVYVLTGIGVFRLSDDETEWLRLIDTIGTYGLTGLSVDPSSSSEVFVSSYFGVFKSQDGGNSFSQITVPELNYAPVIAQQHVTSLDLPAETLTIDVDSLVTFTDLNGDELTYTIDGSSLVNATVDGQRVSLTALRVGNTTLRITADDGRGGSASAFVQVAVVATGAPTLTERFITFLDIPAGSLTIDVDSIAAFSDPNGDPLSYSVGSTPLVDATVDGKTITLRPRQVGNGQIVLEASDGRGGIAQAHISIRVETLSNRSPTFPELQPLSFQLNQLRGPRQIWVRGFDPDGDDVTVEPVSYPDFIEMSPDGREFYAFVAKGPGEGTITWRADDGNGGVTTVDQDISISVPTTGPPVALYYLDTIRVEPTDLASGITTVGLDSIFLDPDGDSLTYTVFSQQPEVGTAEVDGSVVTITPLSEGVLIVSVRAEDGSGGTWGEIKMQVGTPPDPPVLIGSPAGVESPVGVAQSLDFSSVFSSELALTFSGSPVDWEGPNLGAIRTVEGQTIFTGAIPGEGQFHIWARDIFGQQASTTIDITVVASTQDFGPFAFELDPEPGMQSLHVQEDVTPGATIVVEALGSLTGSGNFIGALIYDPAHVEPLLDTFVYGESIDSGDSGSVSGQGELTPEPYWDGVRNSIRLNAQLTGVAASPNRLFSVSFVVQPGFTESTRIQLENPNAWIDGVTYQTPNLEVELRASLNGDFNRDGEVGFADFLEFASSFGSDAPAGSAAAAYDLDRSGDVGFGDFLIFAAAFGSTV